MQQPPLTRLLRGLEYEFGRAPAPSAAAWRTADRGRTGPAGEARAVLVRSAELENTVRRAARGEAGRRVVGFTPSAALHPFLSSVLLAFQEEASAVRVELDEAGTTELVEALLHGRLDAAFIRSPVGSMTALLVQRLFDGNRCWPRFRPGTR